VSPPSSRKDKNGLATSGGGGDGDKGIGGGGLGPSEERVGGQSDVNIAITALKGSSVPFPSQQPQQDGNSAKSSLGRDRKKQTKKKKTTNQFFFFGFGSASSEFSPNIPRFLFRPRRHLSVSQRGFSC